MQVAVLRNGGGILFDGIGAVNGVAILKDDGFVRRYGEVRGGSADLPGINGAAVLFRRHENGVLIEKT